MKTKMSILITGRKGFIAKNLQKRLQKKYEIITVSHDDSKEYFYECCAKCDLVFHLAAVQRSDNDNDFIDGNVHFTEKLIKALEDNKNYVPIVFTTSIWIDKNKDDIFSKTKLEAEKILRNYGYRYRKNIIVYKLNNIFGEFGKPNYNNVIATFCNNIVNSNPIQINNPGILLPLTYVEDLIDDFEKIIEVINNYGVAHDEYVKPTKVEYKTLGEIVKILGDAVNRISTSDEFSQKLYKTLYSYYR